MFFCVCTSVFDFVCFDLCFLFVHVCPGVCQCLSMFAYVCPYLYAFVYVGTKTKMRLTQPILQRLTIIWAVTKATLLLPSLCLLLSTGFSYEEKYKYLKLFSVRRLEIVFSGRGTKTNSVSLCFTIIILNTEEVQRAKPQIFKAMSYVIILIAEHWSTHRWSCSCSWRSCSHWQRFHCSCWWTSS